MPDLSQAIPEKDLSQWHAPSSRPEDVHQLILGVDRYNPSNLGLMEDYLSSQVSSGEYDLLANLAILKLYQFNPHLSNPEIIINILVKALVSTVQGPDFNLCISLLREPSAIVNDIESDDTSLEVVMPYLQQLHKLIRTCQFTSFWTELNSGIAGATILRDAYLPQHPHIQETIRHLFATSIASSFSRIALSRLERWLDLQPKETQGWCESVGWTIEGDVAVVPKNADNNVKAGVVKENVELNQLTKLIAAAAY